MNEQQWQTVLRAVNEYTMHVFDAAEHRSASKTDISRSSALTALGRLRKVIEDTAPSKAEPVMGGRESVEEALEVVESFGPGVEGVNDTFARQILLAGEVKRLRDAYMGAREDLAIWKRQALEAEAKLRLSKPAAPSAMQQAPEQEG